MYIYIYILCVFVSLYQININWIVSRLSFQLSSKAVFRNGNITLINIVISSRQSRKNERERERKEKRVEEENYRRKRRRSLSLLKVRKNIFSSFLIIFLSVEVILLENKSSLVDISFYALIRLIIIIFFFFVSRWTK